MSSPNHPLPTGKRGLSRLRAAAFWVCLSLGLGRLLANSPEATQAFMHACHLFQGGWYDQADKEFAAFLTTYPASTNRDEAVLLQAQSRFQLRDYPGVIRLLQARVLTNAPPLDLNLYWLAQAQGQLEQFDAAAQTYADLLKNCPHSELRLEASYGEAWARNSLGDTARTVELLGDPNGAFQKAAQTSTNHSVRFRGGYLLAEAQFAQRNFQAAEQSLSAIGAPAAHPEAEWQRQHLLSRIELASGRGEAALGRVTNLLAIAQTRSNAVMQASSMTLKGEILEEIQPELAATAYAGIIEIVGVPPEQKRQAVLKLADLAISQERLTNAVVQLTRFLESNTEDPAGDLVHLTLGETYLRRFRDAIQPSSSAPGALVEPNTNLLHEARSQFEVIIQRYTNSPYLGKALLNRAWCSWEEAQARRDPARLIECQKELQAAIRALPKSLDQARARFKLADCFLELKDYSQALTNYRAVVEQYADLPEAGDGLLEQALYQTVRTAVFLRNFPVAEQALERMLGEFSSGSWADRAVLAYGQALSEAGEFAKAQPVFSDFEKRFPESLLLPDMRLAQARGYARQADWPAAIQRLESWLGEFTNHVARPQAEFDRGWSYYQAGNETNAYAIFTNLVHRYPGTGAGALGQLWLGDYYLNRREYISAERSYQFLSRSTNSAIVPLKKQAMLMAAKAAFFRQGYADARKYLMALVEDPTLGPEAWFMLGDIELEDRSRDATNKLAKFEEAINRFSRVTNFYANSRWSPLAMGKIANCHFQLAAQHSNRYEMATNQYLQLILAPQADVPTRSQAEVVLGQVLEKMADQRTNRTELLNGALTHYLSVVYGRRLRPGEEPDPFWVSQAALAAGTLAADRLQRGEEAERLYRDMMKTLPSLQSLWEKRIEALRHNRAHL